MFIEKQLLEKLSFRREAEILKALGHPIRLKILYGLLSGKCNVSNMQECLGIQQASLSQHLSVLKHVGVIEGERDKNQIIYDITSSFAIKLLNLINKEKN
ncbi:MAG: metalloregulator ArsR/SmtB family transcription factor [Spirochaetota bacterium]|nr:metalloregulator ArsR/SmtB family transcription factor [Spirochaetota bacterium]